MGKHTISHADRFKAGNGIAFNDPDDPNDPRGIPIALVAIETFAAVTTDPDAIATTQTPAAGGQQDLTLDGVLVTAGIATLTAVSAVSITAVGNESARTFTVIGTDANGRPQAEEIAGPNATEGSGVKMFSTVSRIFVDANTAAAVTVGELTSNPRGLRCKSRDLVDFYMATEAGIPQVGDTFAPGNNTTQTATTADQRAQYTPALGTNSATVMYFPDLTKEGSAGANFVDASQSVPSAI